MRKVLFLFPVLLLVFFTGCKDNPTEPANGNGQVKVYMVDAPASYDGVFIDVTAVEVHKSGSDSTSGWITLNSSEKTYNLLDLQNGAQAVIGNTMLASGHYTQIRLILGNDNYLTMGGIKYNLTVASGSQTGIKLTHEFDVQANATYNLTLDFNAAQSIVATGSGKFMLKPTIRIVPNQTSGTISGIVLPAEAKAHIWTVTTNSDTVSADADSTGYFKLMALPESSYNLNISADDTMYTDTTLTGVKVMSNENTDIGTVTLAGK